MDTIEVHDIAARLIALGRQIAATGMVLGAGGNISAREGERILMSARGARLGELSEEQIVALDVEGTPLAGEAPANGAPPAPLPARLPAPQPSSEWRIHVAAYRARPEARFVVHAHPPYCIALGHMKWPLPALTPDQYLHLGEEVPLVGYHAPTTPRLASAVEEQLALGAVAVLLRKHGALVTGESAEQVRLRLELLEESARIAVILIGASPMEGRTKGLSKKEMRELDEATGGRYKTNGQAKNVS